MKNAVYIGSSFSTMGTCQTAQNGLNSSESVAESAPKHRQNFIIVNLNGEIIKDGQEESPSSEYAAQLRQRLTFIERCELSTTFMAEIPEKIPVIIDKSLSDYETRGEMSATAATEELKYLVPHHFRIPCILNNIRKKLDLEEKESLFLYAHGQRLNDVDENIGQIYQERKSVDGFLYLTLNNQSPTKKVKNEYSAWKNKAIRRVIHHLFGCYGF